MKRYRWALFRVFDASVIPSNLRTQYSPFCLFWDPRSVGTMLQLKLSKVEHANATDIDSGRLSAAWVALTSEMVFAYSFLQ